MSYRFPSIAPADQSPTQRVANTMLQKMLGDDAPYKYEDTDGCPLGPYAVLLYNPTLIEPWINLAANVTSQEIFTLKEKELVILAVTAIYDAPYILYAHTAISTGIGFAQEQTTSASKGEIPNGLTHSETVLYKTALELVNGRKQLSDESWQKAFEALGREKTA